MPCPTTRKSSSTWTQHSTPNNVGNTDRYSDQRIPISGINSADLLNSLLLLWIMIRLVTDPSRKWLTAWKETARSGSTLMLRSGSSILMASLNPLYTGVRHACANPRPIHLFFFCLTRIVCLFILFYLCFFFEVQTGLGFRFDLLHSGRSCRAGTGGCVDHCSFLCGRNSSPLCRHLSPSSSKESCFSFLFSWIILGNQTSISLPWRLTGVGGGRFSLVFLFIIRCRDDYAMN